MKIYLDLCCLNRPFDDQTQDRIRLESEAVLLILAHIQTGEWEWIGSDVLDFEIEQAPDSERKNRVRVLLSGISTSVSVERTEEARAQHLEKRAFHTFDALHLACAESGGADVFLTTDDRLMRLATRRANELLVRVQNPLTWLREVTAQ